ncbi:MAG TPA: EVE domain-containing protein [Gemmatimonadales bacterium]|nr:EVE domain-containing protein [Gemmatimonadales bacterium]
MPQYWILKTEPSEFSFQQLMAERSAVWDGISNALALKHLRTVATGDHALIYHTGDERALVGLALVTKGAYPDPKLRDPKRVVIDVSAERPLARPVPLAQIKDDAAFADLGLVRISRLSVIPVSPAQWRRLVALGGKAPGRPAAS